MGRALTGLPWTWGNPASDHGHTDCWERHVAADLLDAIDALHQPEPTLWYTHRCRHDHHSWPCPTARLLHPEVPRQ